MIYTLTAILLLFFTLAYWRSPKNAGVVFQVAVIWLILFEGLRWQIGTDWEPYYEFFFHRDEAHMGFAYRGINEFVNSFFGSYTALLLLIAGFTYLTIFRLFKKFSPNPLMSLLIYYCSMVGLWGCNRQILALMVCIIATKYIFERNLLNFTLAMLVAASLHLTSLIFFPAYFLYTWRLSNRTMFLAILVAFLCGLLHMIDRLPYVDILARLDAIRSGETDFRSYADSYEGSVSMIGAVKRILFVWLALRTKKRIRNQCYDFFCTLYVTGCVIYLLFNGSVLQLIAGRGALYYSIYETLVVPFFMIYLPVDKVSRKIGWIAVFSMYFYLMWRDMNSYYMSLGFDIYNPYKSVFSLYI